MDSTDSPNSLRVARLSPKSFTATCALTPDNTSSMRWAINCPTLNNAPGIFAKSARIDCNNSSGDMVLSLPKFRCTSNSLIFGGKASSSNSLRPARWAIEITCGYFNNVLLTCLPKRMDSSNEVPGRVLITIIKLPS